MSVKNIITKLLVLVLLAVSTGTVVAQDKGVDKQGNKIASYYIDITNSVPQKGTPYTLDMNDSSLDIQYHDYIGKSRMLELRLINWKREVVSSFQLQKEFGLNFFHIPMNATSQGIINEKVYTIEMSDELGKKHAVLLQWIVPEVTEMAMNVIVNPKYLECAYEEGNNVEFYADLSGGKSPYTVNWYVMNDTRTDFLYQPRSEKIAHAGKTTSILVDKSPDYYVLVRAVDACGNEIKQTVYLTCEEGKKKINSLFVSPLDRSSLPVKAGN